MVQQAWWGLPLTDRHRQDLFLANVAAMAQPTTFQENRSTTTARNSQPYWVHMIRHISRPDLIGGRHRKLAPQVIRCDGMGMPTLGGGRPPFSAFHRDLRFQHQRPGSDRGREGALSCAPPPSEPYVQFSRIRLSSQ